MENVVLMISAAASLVSAIVLILVLVKIGRLASAMESNVGGGLNFSAADLGAELAGPIQTAFKDHEKSALGALESARKALDEAAGKLGSALTAHAQQVEKIDAASREQLKAALAQHVENLGKQLQQQEKIAASQNEQLKAALAQHVEGLGKAASAIAGQLDKIMQLEKDIQQVLHVQQVVDGSIKAVSTAEEFKSTLAALRKHLEQSDTLIREATKPRTIRLVEQEG